MAAGHRGHVGGRDRSSGQLASCRGYVGVFADPSFCTEISHGGNGQVWYTHQEPSLLVYLLTAVLAAFFAWYGVNQRSRVLINLGSVAFAATVLWFYLSSVMGKLGRSFSLIGLGILFLAGGWLLERLRRRLVGSIGDAPKEAA